MATPAPILLDPVDWRFHKAGFSKGGEWKVNPVATLFRNAPSTATGDTLILANRECSVSRGRTCMRIGAAAALLLATPLMLGSTGRRTSLDARLLAAQNREREAAGLPALQWDDALASDAADWGRELAERGDLEHAADDPDDEDPQGENLWLGTRGAYTPEEMVGMWAEEKKDFRPGIFPDNSRTGKFEDVGHYTQLMWRATGRVGCALADGRPYEVLVCRYREAGNVEGERPF